MAASSAVAERIAAWREAWKIYGDPRVLAILALGFSSGLPIMLVATTLSTWLAEAQVSKASIGLFAYVFAPYTFKFAWAPFMDRLPLPPLTTWFGRRRGWMLATQLGLILSIYALGQTEPQSGLYWTALCAVFVAFFSASQDIVIDAYRIEILPKEELGAGAGVVVLGYRIAMWVATAGTLLIADAAGWPTAYTTMALLVLIGVVTVLLVREPEGSSTDLIEPDIETEEDQLGRVIGAGGQDRDGALGGVLMAALAWLLLIEPASFLFGVLGPYRAPLGGGELLLLLGNAGIMLFGVAAGARILGRHPAAMRWLKTYALAALAWSVIEVLWYVMAPAPAPYLGELYAWLGMILLWALADGVTLLLGGGGFDLAGFTSPIWLVILGFWLRFFAIVALYGMPYFSRRAVALFGLTPLREEARLHLWMRRAVIEPFYDFFRRHGVAVAVLVLALISVFKASDVILTLMANPFYIEMGFTKAQIAWVSKTFGLWMTLLGGLVGGTIVYRLGIMRSLAVAVVVMALSNLSFLLLAASGDGGSVALSEFSRLALFHVVIIIENLSGGLGTAVFVAYLSSLCNLHYTAVQYALLTSFMQLFGKFVIVPSSGFFVEAAGWQLFFITSTLFALPALLLIWLLYRMGVEVEPVTTGGPARGGGGT